MNVKRKIVNLHKRLNIDKIIYSGKQKIALYPDSSSLPHEEMLFLRNMAYYASIFAWGVAVGQSQKGHVQKKARRTRTSKQPRRSRPVHTKHRTAAAKL